MQCAANINYMWSTCQILPIIETNDNKLVNYNLFCLLPIKTYIIIIHDKALFTCLKGNYVLKCLEKMKSKILDP